MAKKARAAHLEYSLDAAAEKVRIGLIEMFPKELPRAGPDDGSTPEARAVWRGVMTTATILGAQVLKQAMKRRTINEPSADSLRKLLAEDIAATLKTRVFNSGLANHQILTMIQQLCGGASIGNIECWMIPHLLQCCGLKRERAEGSLLKVLRKLEELVDQLDEFPQFGEPIPKSTGAKHRDRCQQEMDY